MKYLYYKMWQDFTGVVKGNSPAVGAMIWLSVILGVNIYTLQKALEYCLNITFFNFIKTKNELILSGVFFFLSLMIINYFLLYKKREKISEKYKNESKIKSRIGLLFLYIYMIGSFFLIYFVSEILPMHTPR